MKKIFFLCLFTALTTFTVVALPGNEVPQKVKATFYQQYPRVKKAVFYNHGNSYEAYFKKDENILVRVYYDLKGKIGHTITYYSGGDLNPFIKTKLKKEYDGKSVYGVTEYQSKSDHYYQITLQDDARWYFVYLDNNGSVYAEKVCNKG